MSYQSHLIRSVNITLLHINLTLSHQLVSPCHINLTFSNKLISPCHINLTLLDQSISSCRISVSPCRINQSHYVKSISLSYNLTLSDQPISPCHINLISSRQSVSLYPIDLTFSRQFCHAISISPCHNSQSHYVISISLFQVS